MVKKEMKMMPNGNYDEIISPVQHKCKSNDYKWICEEYGWKLGTLELTFEKGDPFEDGCSHEIEVNFCPFCGYSPKKELSQASVKANV